MKRQPSPISGPLLWFVLLYTAASLIHFVHNAEFLDAYPSLPEWITRASVYVTWLGMAAIGACGYALHRSRWNSWGLLILALYASLGFDGLLHYTRAPLAAHSMTMNVTILLEAATAALLLLAVVGQAVRNIRRGAHVGASV